MNKKSIFMLIIRSLKALMYFSTAIVFSMVTFYDINLTVTEPTTNESFTIISPTFLMNYFSDVFEVQKISFALVIIFLVLGILEILEIFNNER